MNCKTCFWWQCESREHFDSAECWLNPPTVLDNVATKGNTYSYERPQTDKNDYCSHHTPIGDA